MVTLALAAALGLSACPVRAGHVHRDGYGFGYYGHHARELGWRR